jgi:hypothetical protein
MKVSKAIKICLDYHRNHSKPNTIRSYEAILTKFGLIFGDKDLIEYYLQQFSNNPDEIISPLGMIHIWLKKGLISWDEKLQTILEDWNKCDEAPQPRTEIKKFQNLTGYKYLGT